LLHNISGGKVIIGGHLRFSGLPLLNALLPERFFKILPPLILIAPKPADEEHPESKLLIFYRLSWQSLLLPLLRAKAP
jgi:hypothetical protein